uniref:5-oxoprolinase (ATP-hydrolysing) n=1 Tax=Kwoniella dejecticola CBS 10117 TaxID=1296121 RepID=A0A1A5ZWJ8_9TREE|nr:uncharacterized protein I303_08088 [Kwoniella dejecticola CBS 10117]OBR82174.1 hypothetical protein I303_08088 [Kwoniella dejecticola CBS 10117]
MTAGPVLARIAIDRGGTFTDSICTRGEGYEDIVVKLLSVDPSNYKDAPTECIRRILEKVTGRAIPKSEKLKLDQVESIRMGTTVSTNALLERQGERCALITTKGYRDVMKIGMQARPSIFDLSIKKLAFLYEEVVEVDERVTIETFAQDPDPQPIDIEADSALKRGVTGEIIRVIKKPDPQVVKQQLEGLWEKGFRSLAIALVHSYTFTKHEEVIAALAKEMGFSVSISHQLQPMIKIVSRANSATADAYLTPVTRRYLESFGEGFEGGIEAFGNKLLFMQSDGGLCTWNNFSGLRAILSGPAGGVIGFTRTCYDESEGIPLIGCDIGGTSTDVSRYNGKLEHVFETAVAQVIVQAPQLDINTVAAGGGSRLFYRNGMFIVGPESAGAHPGPACYKKGGPLAITDANLVLGRLLPEHFPAIFGPNEDEPLDVEASRKLFAEMSEKINSERGRTQEKLTIEQIAAGFLNVASEAVCRPIRTLTEARGHESSNHHLVMFGGAGGQLGTGIAHSLGISRIIIPRFSSILSAYGMSLADVVSEIQEPSSLNLGDNVSSSIRDRFDQLEKTGAERLFSQGFSSKSIRFERYLNCRYQGSATQLMIAQPEGQDFAAAFVAEHQQQFGFTLQDRAIMCDDIRVRAIGLSGISEISSPYADFKKANLTPYTGSQYPTKKVFFEGPGYLDTAVVRLDSITPGKQVQGPAILFDTTQTILVEPGYIATVLAEHVLIDLHTAPTPPAALDPEHVDPVKLAVMGHRFMSIAEQMGSILRQISISTNIKERLDFSCALFSPDGGLVANAPHIPCHLGAMSHAVRFQAQLHGDSLEPGDCLLSNHPSAGGSHLPDCTVIVPAFHQGKIVFWTAARAHHADIGGMAAGSMPPFSKEIWQEGAQIKSFKIVKKGVFDEAGVKFHFYDEPGKYPGCAGTRTLADNISDLKAQIASCHRGAMLIESLVQQDSLEVVQFYMAAIQRTAELAVRDMLRTIYKKHEGKPLQAMDSMDCGAEIHLKIDIDPVTGGATFDFTGTSPQVYGNLNAPTAILYSGVIYVLRSLLSVDIPLNQGCLLPINIILPKGTILSPSEDAATVGGNVDTSQRVTDTILRAFQACGASQGTCNNLTFGYGGEKVDGKQVAGFGYYETIAGGAGAGPSWQGQDCVHVHMTNTAIGDVEIIERQYPVIIHEFSQRIGSGGAGKFRGGDGCVRDIEFTRKVDVAILSQRRAIAPYGMRGGQPGAKGVNQWIRKTGDVVRLINLGGNNECVMNPGDHIIINTPGGGGYGTPEDASEVTEKYQSPQGLLSRANGFLASFYNQQNTN